MNVHTFVQEFNEKFPHIERFDDATPELIAKYEKELGFPLPKSFVEFLMYFPKGIQLLDVNLSVELAKIAIVGIFVNLLRFYLTYQMKY